MPSVSLTGQRRGDTAVSAPASARSGDGFRFQAPSVDESITKRYLTSLRSIRS